LCDDALQGREKFLMTAPIVPTEPSLIPYVDPGKAGLRLRLNGLRTQDGHPPESLATIEGTGPYAAIVEGAVTAGGQCPAMADLFILVQPDLYPDVSSELTPVTNLDVEQLWQAAATRMRASQSDCFSGPLPEQIDAEGRTVPWRSLFYCRHTQRYFHPLCPQCGGALTLCRDDRILEEAGLPGYTYCLSRFLHCPACHRHAPVPLFYTRLLPPDPPAHLIGVEGLIEGFSRLLARQDLAHALPCVACDHETDCYGPPTLVHQRMIPLFFYPFHMLTQPAPSLNMLEFQELLTGTAIDRIELQLTRRQKPGRLRMWRRFRDQPASGNGMLFQQTGKRFGEVLYLKLTLLDALFDKIRRTAGHLAEPLAGMSLESLWVSLPAQAARLPFCWNFSLQLIDAVGRPDPDAVPGQLSRARAATFLGTAWCHVLLVNPNQDMRTVLKAVDTILLTGSAEPDTHNQGRTEQAAPTWSAEPFLDPCNLVSFPLSSPIDGQWPHFWQCALGMGFDLLRAGRGADASWGDERFGQRLDALRQAVHTALFQEAATAVVEIAPASARKADDAAIAIVVRSLLAEWPQASEPETNTTDVAPDAEAPATGMWQQIPDSAEGDFQATVILGSEEAFGVQAPPDPPDRPDLEQTVVLDTGGQAPSNATHAQAPVTAGNEPARAAADPPPAAGQMEQTLILQPPLAAAGTRDDLEATVMIDAKGSAMTASRPSPPPSPTAAGNRTPEPSMDAADDMDDLAQTVILPPRERKPGP
jgi:hypothetical protein